MKKISVFVITCILLLNIAACSDRNASTEDGNKGDISEHYIESEISLPESIYTVTSVYTEALERIRIAGYDNNESNNSVWEWNGEAWNQILNLQEFLEEADVDIDQTSSFDVSVSESGEILVLCKGDLETQMLIIDSEFNITANTYINEMLTQYSITLLKQVEKDLYLLTDGMGKIYVLNSENETVTSVNAENEYTLAQKYVDGYLYLLTTEELRVIDCKTMKEVSDDEVKKWINQFVADTEDFSINFDISNTDDGTQCYIATSSGITKLAKEEQTLLVDGSRTALGNNNLSVNSLSVYNESIVALMAEEDESKLYIYEYTDEVAKIENELVVYALEENQGLSQAVNLYNQQNPTVKIKIEIGMSDDSISMSDALKQLNIELEAGNGPDIIILDGMDIDSYITKGVLLDISDIVTKSKESGNVLNNIVDTYETDGKMYAVPAKFFAMYVSSKNDDIVENSQDMDTLYRKLIALNEVSDHDSIIDEWSFNQVVSVLYRGMLAKGNDELTEEQISTFYEIVEALYEIVDLKEVIDETDRKLADITDRPITYNDFNFTAIDLIEVALDYISSLSDLQIIETLKDSELSSYSFLGSNDSYYYIPSMVAGISVKSDHQEVAQGFISFLLGEEVQSDYDAEGLPVNISGIKNKIAALKEENYVVSPESGHSHEDDVGTKTLNVQLQQFTEQEIEDIIKEMKRFKIAVKDDSYIRNIVLTEADKIIFNGSDKDPAVRAAMHNIKIYKDE